MAIEKRNRFARGPAVDGSEERPQGRLVLNLPRIAGGGRRESSDMSKAPFSLLSVATSAKGPRLAGEMT
jgi:hypothetical protein